MAFLESPRLDPDDKIDTFLSRYSPQNEAKPGSLAKITWQGFISPTWTYKTFVKILVAVPKEYWFAYSITGYADDWETGGHHSLILKLPNSSADYVLWDVN